MKKHLYLFVIGILAFSLQACKDDTGTEQPFKADITVITLDVTDIEGTTAKAGGKITSENDSPVSARGVCWSTSENPTVGDDKTSDGTGTGEFTSTISGLVKDTKYYVRAYAVSGDETFYGRQVTFTAGQAPPSLTTAEVTDITTTTATGGGTITDEGSSEVIEAGICWSTEEYPTTDDDNTVEDVVNGKFTSNLIYLTPGTTYYVRAYATNKGGTGYGNQVTFTTKPESTYTVTDPKFMAYLLETFDSNNDGLLQESEMFRIISIDIQNEEQGYGIESLDGIKQFTNLRELRCSFNNFRSLDVGGMENLVVLWCFRSQLQEINVKGCTSLEFLHIYENELRSVDISDCLALKEFESNENQLAGDLNLDNHKQLVKAGLIRNNLDNITARGIETLFGIWCDGNGLKTLDVSGSSLEDLYCQENELTSLKVDGCRNLVNFVMFENNISGELDLSGMDRLEILEGAMNRLTGLDVSGCVSLRKLVANENQLATITGLADCHNLTESHVNGNQLTAFEFDRCPNLEILGFIGNRVSRIEMKNHGKIRGLWCDGNEMEILDLSGCASLFELFCQFNRITQLNLAGCTSLVHLESHNNILPTLDLSGCTSLERLMSYQCEMTSLKLPTSNSLVDVRCAQNRLTSLEVHSTNLLELHCQDNLFNSLDVTGCGSLRVIFGYGNPNLPSVNLSGCAEEMAFVEFHNCPSLNTITMKTGQNVIDSFQYDAHTQIVYI